MSFNEDYYKVIPPPGFRKSEAVKKMNIVSLKRDSTINQSTIKDFVNHYKINTKITQFDFRGTVNIKSANLTELPVYIHCVEETFDCSGNLFNNFDDKFPSTIGGHFYCVDGHLMSTKNIPVVKHCVDLSRNHITKLEDMSHLSFTSLCLANNKIKSLAGAPKYIDSFLDVSYNKICSMKNVHLNLKYCEQLDLSENSIEEGGIGLILVPGLNTICFSTRKNEYVPFFDALTIIRKYLGQGKKGLLACQEDLIANNLDEFAIL